MQKLGKLAFALAPVCLIASFFSSAVLRNDVLMAVFIVLATVLLVLALAGKTLQSRGQKEGGGPL